MHFDCVNGFLNSIKEIIWQTEAIYRCPLRVYILRNCNEKNRINKFILSRNLKQLAGQPDSLFVSLASYYYCH